MATSFGLELKLLASFTALEASDFYTVYLCDIYRVIQEERSVFWEVMVLVIMRKKG
jgi:hypothetical protein